jgi:pimeloyl-ACP methyl ester carboxylesterase
VVSVCGCGDCQSVRMTPAREVVKGKRKEVCAPHPSVLFPRETTDLLSSIAGVPVVAVGPPPSGATSLQQIVAAMEEKRCSVGLEPWAIWGMSGGSFLAQLYAHMYPTAVAGLILASSGPYFRTTVKDPDCILSPYNPAWSSKLSAAGLLDGEYEVGATSWEIVADVGWVFRRSTGAALVVSPEEPSVEMQAIMPALWAYDARPWLGTVATPTLVMCGTADPVVPLRHAETLAALIPNAHFVAIDAAGHIPLTSHRVEVEGAVRAFLQSL